jgi:hypothetical protein
MNFLSKNKARKTAIKNSGCKKEMKDISRMIKAAARAGRFQETIRYTTHKDFIPVIESYLHGKGYYTDYDEWTFTLQIKWKY